MPQVAKTIRTQLNVDEPVLSSTMQQFLPAGHQIGKPAPLFQKLEQTLINQLKVKYGGQQPEVKEKKPKSQNKKSGGAGGGSTKKTKKPAAEAPVEVVS
jgi:methionyl-tRNA synthetase